MKILETLLWNKRDELCSWVPLHFRFGSWEVCFYCGQEPQASDHVIPWSFLFNEVERKADTRGILTPACKSCNSRLSSFYFDSLWERCAYVRHSLESDYGLNPSPNWKQGEVDELKGQLKGYVIKRQEELRIAGLRISWQKRETFHKMFEEAHEHSKNMFPHNPNLHAFMKPWWPTNAAVNPGETPVPNH